jgi:hypothetical protein
MSRIRVGVRVKPESGAKLGDFSQKASTNHKGENISKIEISVQLNSSNNNNSNSNRTEFIFDDFFDENCQQQDVFLKCAKPIIDEVLEGYLCFN